MFKKVCTAVVAGALVAGGCRPGLKPLPVCPGKGSVSGALSAMKQRTEAVRSLRASGTARLEYYLQDKRKAKKEAFAVKLWLNPPSQVYLQGSVGLDPKAVVLGSNDKEFWLAIRPKKVSTYWWGLWSKNQYGHNLMLSPRIVVEALGAASMHDDGQADWSLENDGPFDILTKRTDAGLPLKRFYVCSCDYLVRKIEYFDEFGQVDVVAELDKYTQVAEGFFAPRSIKVRKLGTAGRDDSASITLKSIKPYRFNRRQLELLFVRPGAERFETVYEVVGGKWVERSG